MKIPIKTSWTMDNAKENIIQESRVIRAPREFRQFADLHLGDFVTLRAHNGELLLLTIEKAYDDDVKADSLCAYLTSRIYNLVAEKQAQVCNLNIVNGITLGCDPELMIIDRNTGNLVSAQNFFGLRKQGEIGYDGLLIEFRPLPSIHESVVVDNIYTLLTKARTYLDSCQMFPSTMLAGISSFRGKAAVARNVTTNTVLFQPHVQLTAGFHLHYGIPREILGWKKNFVAKQVVKALDYYVGLPSIIPEGYNDSYRRTVQGLEYGKPGMFRLDDRTLEYRTPGASLMKHPILAQGLIGLGATVIEDICSRVKTITNGFTQLDEIASDADIKILYPHIPPVMELFRAICSPTIDVAKRHLDTIRRDVEDMVGYAGRANSINNFFDNIETTFSIDVEDNWWRYRNHGERQSG